MVFQVLSKKFIETSLDCFCFYFPAATTNGKTRLGKFCFLILFFYFFVPYDMLLNCAVPSWTPFVWTASWAGSGSRGRSTSISGWPRAGTTRFTKSTFVLHKKVLREIFFLKKGLCRLERRPRDPQGGDGVPLWQRDAVRPGVQAGVDHGKTNDIFTFSP